MRRLTVWHGVFAAAAAVLAFSAAGCLEILSVTQPAQVDPSASFQITVNFYTAYDAGANNQARFGAVMLPNGFTVTNVTFCGTDPLPYDAAMAARIQADHPADAGYFWWAGTTVQNSPQDQGCDAVVDVTTGSAAGTYFLDYAAGYYADPVMHYEDWDYDHLLSVGAPLDTDGDGMPDWWEDLFACVDSLTGDSLADPDSDTVANLDEYLGATDPCVQNDGDGDGMPDHWEALYPCMQPGTPDAGLDYDFDYTSNLDEYLASTDPCVAEDTDGDGMPDWWEDLYACVDSLTGDSLADPDSDTVANLDEYIGATDPCVAEDGDGDGMPDHWEALYPCMQPGTPDAGLDYDFDSATNLSEYQGATDPCVGEDTDGDGMPDGWEDLYACVDKLMGDSTLDPDWDLIANLAEYQGHTDPCMGVDTDGDGMPDGWENYYWCMQPLMPDAGLDYDMDSFSNLTEFQLSTDPCEIVDSDGDGMPDGWEDSYACVNSLVGDSALDPDGDGGLNLAEYHNLTDPCGAEPWWHYPVAFMKPASSPVSTTPYKMAAGDLNKDGRQDVAVVHNNSNYTVLMNDGDGTFTATGGTVGSRLRDVVVVTLVGDTIPDLVFSDFINKSIRVMTGDGVGSFSLFASVSAGSTSGPDGIVAGDFNKDGLTDVAVSKYGERKVDIFLGNLSGSFNPMAAYSVASPYSCDLAAGDVNGDEVLDLVIPNWNYSNFSVLLGDGNGGFSAPINFSNTNALTDVALGDVDNDGKVDTVFANQTTDGVQIMKGDGLGGFTLLKHIPTGNNPFQVRLADFNSDGLLDIATANQGAAPGLSVILSHGYGHFTPVYQFHSDAAANGLAVGDFNFDFRLDVAMGHTDNTVRVSFGVGVDTDADVLADADEAYYFTNTTLADTDGDLMPDGLEVKFWCLRPAVNNGGVDSDGDGPSNLAEYQAGTDPCNALADTDGDKMDDAWENSHPCVDAGAADAGDDPDLDGLTNVREYRLDSDPCAIMDTDADGMPDWWEDSYACVDSQVGDSTLDPDADSVDNLDEFRSGTDPCVSNDTDGDGMPDGWESAYTCMNPLSPDGGLDYDNDYATNQEEYWQSSDPCVWEDTDGDLMPDGWENHYACVDRLVGDSTADPDSDTLANLQEFQIHTDPCVDGDDDGDGMPDKWEAAYGCMEPNTVDADGDGDGDLWTNLEEYQHSTDPCVWTDTDGDLMPDGWEDGFTCVDRLVGDSAQDPDFDYLTNLQEYQASTDPCVGADSDGDGLGDGIEVNVYGTNPASTDTDGDGVPDGYEVNQGSNPVDAGVTPRAITLSGSPLTPGDCSLAWSGSEYGITWAGGGSGEQEIYFRRVTGDGAPVGSDVRVTTAPYDSIWPSISWSGSEYGISYFDYRGDDDGLCDCSVPTVCICAIGVYFSRLAADGTKQGGDSGLFSQMYWNDYFGGYGPTLGRSRQLWNGSCYATTWIDNDSYWFARISPQGTASLVDVAGTAGAPRIPETTGGLSWTGSEFGVAWSKNGPDYHDIGFRRVSAAGALVGSVVPINSTPDIDDMDPVIDWTGSEYDLRWTQYPWPPNPPIVLYPFTNISGAGAEIGPRIYQIASWDHLIWISGLPLFYAENHDPAGEIRPFGTDQVVFTGDEYGACLWSSLYRFILDRDGDGLADDDEAGYGANLVDWDSDNDGLTDGVEVNTYGSDPNDADSDDDGIEDGDEVNTYGTAPDDWDSDGDYLPDGYEVGEMSGHSVGEDLDPLDALDGAAGFDGDGMPNNQEYWNGSGLWSDDPAPTPGYEVGCYYWGKSDGGIAVQPADIVAMQKAYVGVSVDYSQVLPSQYDPMDLDRDMFPGPGDIVLAQGMYAGLSRPGGYVSSPAALTVEEAPAGPVAVGDTTHVTVSVHAAGPGAEEFSPGMGVVFWVTSGNAVLLGGEGTDPGEAAGNRYDVSMKGADGAPANIVVLVTGAGPITINAKVPSCGTEPLGRWCAEVGLAAPVEINP